MENNYEIRKFLLGCGISANMTGFHTILEAIELIKEKPDLKFVEIYQKIYEKGGYNSKSYIDRSIRVLIDSSNKIKAIYGTRPTTKQFLYDLIYNLDILKEK